MEEIKMVEREVHELREKIRDIEKSVNNGLKSWVAGAAEKFIYLEFEQREQDKCDKDLDDRLRGLEIEMRELRTKQATIWVIVTIIVTAALNMLFKIF